MNINFKKIDIENFRSIQNATVELANQGTVIVKGINEYEENALSNGSGKSSVFEAIIFALFDETSSGEKDVANRIINNGYSVNLYFSVDGDNYTISRYSKGTKSNVVLYKNDVDISARNKTDTNKLIISILGITKSIFLDSVFLSQSVGTNLTSLTPTARKERLEILTNTDYTINNFKEMLKCEQTKYEGNCVKAKLDLTKLEGKVDAINSQKLDIQSKINKINEQIARRNALGNLETIEDEIQTAQKNIEIQNYDLEQKELAITAQETKIEEYRKTGEDNLTERDNLNTIIVAKREECSNLSNNIDNLNLFINQCNREIIRLQNEIVKIKNSDTCPTCGRKYEIVNDEHIKNTIAELESNIKVEEDKIRKNNEEIANIQKVLDEKIIKGKELRADLDNLDVKINRYKQELENLEKVKKSFVEDRQRIMNNIKLLQANIEACRGKKDQILKIEVGNKEEFNKMLENLDTEIGNIEDEIAKCTEIYTQNNEYEEVVKNSIQLVTKEFRTYLLQNSLLYLNKLLANYSSELFSNEKDIITIDGDDSKLDIYLGNATYESLSGGEKTRVNIALLLAQKSLANIIGNISCNIIILDEILGYCDSHAENNVINLIVRELDSLESIFMVSHKEIPIGYDTQLIIVKNQDGLSSVRSY